MARSITQEHERSKRLNEALTNLIEAIDIDKPKLVELIYELGGTQRMIAEKLNVTPQAIQQKFPKEKK